MSFPCLAIWFIAGAVDASQSPKRPIGGHGPHEPPVSVAHRCASPVCAARARSEADRHRVALGLTGGVAGKAAAGFFYPLAGTVGVDVMNGQFVDLDPSPGHGDFDCRPWTYDGHRGVDGGLRGFAEQTIGVPVFAAKEGTVVFAHDGEPDMNLEGGFLGNVVFIDHGGGVETQYWHLKKDSVLVAVGEQVEAGQEIGRAASSGNSFGPHLHFEVAVEGPKGWQVYEPFAGECREGPSGWLDQEPLDREDPFLVDFGITRTMLDTLSPPWWEPWPLPTDAVIALDDPAIAFWFKAYNVPANAAIGVRFLRPDGGIAVDAAWNWTNPEPYRHLTSWLAWELEWLVPTEGAWRLEFRIDGRLMIDAPFLMSRSIDPEFNRPPVAIDAAFEPVTPESDAPLLCRVLTTPLLEDPDWDVVRYRYLWTVDGTVVRDVTSAAQSDMLRAGAVSPSGRVCCSVTPSDGRAEGVGRTISALAAGPSGDVSGDGVVNAADIAMILGAWGPCDCCSADRSGDGQVDAADLTIVLGSWGS